MPLLRFIVACLLMLALPLQGLAAASMVFCGAGGHEHTQAQPHEPEPAQAHDHAAHAHAEAPAAHAGTGIAEPAVALADDPQKCSVCATCSHGAAIVHSGWPSAGEAIPQAHVVQAVLPLPAIRSALPDKPPRA